MIDQEDKPKDVIVNVTGVSISTQTGIGEYDNQRDPSKDQNRTPVEESPTGD